MRPRLSSRLLSPRLPSHTPSLRLSGRPLPPGSILRSRDHHPAQSAADHAARSAVCPLSALRLPVQSRPEVRRSCHALPADGMRTEAATARSSGGRSSAGGCPVSGAGHEAVPSCGRDYVRSDGSTSDGTPVSTPLGTSSAADRGSTAEVSTAGGSRRVTAGSRAAVCFPSAEVVSGEGGESVNAESPAGGQTAVAAGRWSGVAAAGGCVLPVRSVARHFVSGRDRRRADRGSERAASTGPFP